VTGTIAEMLIGVRRDPVYGATLTLGCGGITAELLSDTVTLVCPVTADEVRDALRSLRLWPLLDGYRGRARADVAAVVDVALRVQAMLAADPMIEEIEINPLMVTTDGAVAADAVIWKEER
jgi:acetate---CoA ligase (ADP-forming)